jgi:hypothetical protein
MVPLSLGELVTRRELLELILLRPFAGTGGEELRALIEQLREDKSPARISTQA